jgi:hypothetical protein
MSTHPSHRLTSALGLAIAGSPTASALGGGTLDTVAITEFLNNANGVDTGREWIEIHNYGPVAIDISGWTLEDNNAAPFTLPNGAIMPPDGGRDPDEERVDVPERVARGGER